MRRLAVFVLLLVTSSLSLIILFFGSVSGQVIQFPACDISDSTASLAPGIDDIVHPFGVDTLTYPNEFDLQTTFPAFAAVFDLYLTDSVSERWSKSAWEDIIGAIMSNDTTNTSDDVFGIVWGYFARDEADQNGAHAGVKFSIWGTTYTKIELRMYDTSDLPCPCTEEYGVACDGYSTSVNNRLLVNASDLSCPPDSCACAPITVDEMLGLGVAHELQHICFAINGPSGGPGGYGGVNETLSTLAEYFVDSWRSLDYDIPYDASFMDREPCDIPRPGVEGGPKYQVYRLWMMYLYETFIGNVSDRTDDLLYRWIHANIEPNYRLMLHGLAAVLWDSEFDWLGGEHAGDRVNRVYANFLVAKYCNAPEFAPNAEFGTGSVNTVWDMGLFMDNCDTYQGGATAMSPVDCPPQPNGHIGCWNVRVLLPSHELNDSHENTIAGSPTIYEDGDAPLPAGDGDHSKDYVDVYIYGTDYVEFRADDYFQDGKEHELKIRVGGRPVSESLEVYGIEPIAWIMAYSSDRDTLQVHPEDLLFVEPLTFSPSATHGDTVVSRTVTVADFGQSVKAVVLAVGAAADSVNFAYWVTNGFVYEYEYGVSTPEIEAFSRVGGTLYAQPDTAAAGCPQGDGDEVVITVALDSVFYDAPIPKSAFSVTAPDTAVLHATAEADSDATLIDGKYRTTITLRQFGACGAGELAVLMNGQSIGRVAVDMRSADMLANGVVAVSDAARFGLAYESPPKAYDVCADYRPAAGTVTVADWGFFGSHYNHYTGGGNASVASTVSTEATLRVDLQEENPLVGDRRLWATVSVENVEPFKALVVSLRSDHPRLRFLGWEPDSQYPSTTMGTEVTRDGIRQAFIGIMGSGTSLGPVVEFGRAEFEVLGEEPLTLSEEDLDFIAADLEVVGGGLRAFSPLRLEKNEMQPSYRFELAQNVPNPFNPTTTIAYSLASDSDVSLVIYDVRGARVKSLVSGHETTGFHRVPWDGTNDRGVRVSSGVYFYRLIAGSFKNTKKMVLLK